MKSYLKFWGTRGSCPVSGPSFAKYGGNTACLEVRYKDTHLIIDAGTGIRPLGETLLDRKQEISLFLGHTHWDHIIGFPFFAPLYNEAKSLAIWMPAKTPEYEHELFERLLAFDVFPVQLDQIQAQIRYCSADPKTPVRIGSVKLHFHPTFHPGSAYAFKIETPYEMIGYATDNEFLPGYLGSLEEIPEELLLKQKSLIQFFSGCDLLIHEAQYFPEEYVNKIGWGHSSLIHTIALVREAKIPKWLVVHHDPKHTDADLDRLATLAKKILKEHGIPCEAEWIGDGHTVELRD